MIEFPCDFPIKIMSIHRPGIADELLTLIRQHYPDLLDNAVKQQLSKNGNYLALTVTIHAQDQMTLDGLYVELTKHPDIKMVL
jgi:uncharacterized protein